MEPSETSGRRAKEKARHGLLWLVYGKYEVVHGWVMPRQIEGGRFYDPNQADELPSALAALAGGNEDDVLDFVHRYGLLGFGLLAPANGELQEHIDWIRAHARGVRLVMDALYATNHGDDRYALEIVQACLQGKTIRWGAIGMGPQIVDLTSDIALLDRSVALNHLALTAEKILNEHLSRARKRVTVTYEWGKPRLVPDHSVMAMIDIVYSKLADLVSSRRWRLCTECGAPLYAFNPRQKFCPPRLGEQESRCSLRFRQRSFRQRHKGGDGDAETARPRRRDDL